MTVGWVDLVIDGKPAIGRICYVRAWDDPDWRRVNGLPPKRPKRPLRVSKTEERRLARQAQAKEDR